MEERYSARDKAVNSQSPADWQNYRRLRNICSHQTETDKTNYYTKIYSDIANEGNTSKLHKTTSELLGWYTGGPPKQFLIGGKLIQSPVEIANKQIKYFSEKIRITRKISLKQMKIPSRYWRKLFCGFIWFCLFIV